MKTEPYGIPGPEASADAATVASGLPLPPTKPSEILSAAADRVAKGWSQGGFARDADGNKLDPIRDKDRAECFCMKGAVYAETGQWHMLGAYQYAIAVVPPVRFPTCAVAAFNDEAGRTQAEVVTALRQAAEKAREAGQ